MRRRGPVALFAAASAWTVATRLFERTRRDTAALDLAPSPGPEPASAPIPTPAPARRDHGDQPRDAAAVWLPEGWHADDSAPSAGRAAGDTDSHWLPAADSPGVSIVAHTRRRSLPRVPAGQVLKGMAVALAMAAAAIAVSLVGGIVGHPAGGAAFALTHRSARPVVGTHATVHGSPADAGAVVPGGSAQRAGAAGAPGARAATVSRGTAATGAVTPSSSSSSGPSRPSSSSTSSSSPSGAPGHTSSPSTPSHGSPSIPVSVSSASTDSSAGSGTGTTGSGSGTPNPVQSAVSTVQNTVSSAPSTVQTVVSTATSAVPPPPPPPSPPKLP